MVLQGKPCGRVGRRHLSRLSVFILTQLRQHPPDPSPPLQPSLNTSLNNSKLNSRLTAPETPPGLCRDLLSDDSLGILKNERVKSKDILFMI